MKRVSGLDIFRGLALMFVVFFHTAVYSFANIDKLDFSNPPIVVVLISFLVLWGGIFIVYSAVVNSALFISRYQGNHSVHLLGMAFMTGLLLLISHYLLTVVLGRWSVDFVHNRPNLTMVAGTVRYGSLYIPEMSKYFEGSSLSIIAINLMVISSLLHLLFKNNGFKNDRLNYLILGFSGLFIMLFSYIRISLFPLTEFFVSRHNYFLATLFSYFIANPYPVIPYLAYGLFGAMLGLMLYKKQFDLIKKVFIPIGLLFLIYGLVGMTRFDKTISKADYFWYFKTQFELGLFLSAMVVFTLPRSLLHKHPTGIWLIPYWFSRVCFTVYLFETLLSEVLRYPMYVILPSWDQTINGCLVFGGLNVAIWAFILLLWQKNNFKYSLEYFWVRLFSKAGKNSTKLDFL